MARPLRLDPEMGIHHVFTRGTKRWTIFHDDIDRQRMLGTLSRVCDRHGITVIAFSLMDNHFHLVVQCPEGGLSNLMRDLKSFYARWFNDRHRSSGPIFEDRFGSKLVTSYRQLRTLVRYVHRNPYAIDPSMNLATYRWSSHPIYLGLRPAPAWLDVSIARGLFSDYRRDVERPIQSDAIQNTPNHQSPNAQVPGTYALELSSFSLAEVLVQVARAASCDVGDVSPQRRNGLIGLAVVIAADYGGYTASEIAEPFGFRTESAVYAAARRTRIRVSNEATLQYILDSTKARLMRRSA